MMEFTDGAMEKLDPFTAVIWPHELAEFNKNMQGTFGGVGDDQIRDCEIEIGGNDLTGEFTSRWRIRRPTRPGSRRGISSRRSTARARWGFRWIRRCIRSWANRGRR